MSDHLVVRDGADLARRVAYDDRQIRNVAGDDRPRTDEGVFPDDHSRQQDAAAAHPRSASDLRSSTDEGNCGASVGHPLVVHGDDTRPAEHVIFDDHTTRDVAAALQRDVVADLDVAFDVDEGADDAVASDLGVASEEHEVTEPSARADQHRRLNDALLTEGVVHAHLLVDDYAA